MDEEKQTTEETNQQETPANYTETEEKSTGAIIGAIIIVVLLVLGGLYFLGQRVNKNTENTLAPEEILSQPDTVTQTLEVQGTSDEVSDIEADLGTTTDFGNLDVELGNIDAEFNF